MKVGYASLDFSPDIIAADGFPAWGGAGWARLGQYHGRLKHETVKGLLSFDKRKKVMQVHECVHTYHAPGMQCEGIDHDNCDIIVMQRWMLDGLERDIGMARANGQIIINDVDDLLWDVHRSNVAHRFMRSNAHNGESVDFYGKVLQASNLVVVSTPYLASVVKEMARTDNVIVVPNFVDFNKFTTREQAAEPTLGWVGSTAHRSNDLEQLRGLTRQWERNGWKFHHSGSQPHAPLFCDAIGVHEATTLPMVDPMEYPSLFTFDVGVVPLNDIPFNRAKSYIKGFEYIAAGVPFVASHVGEYARLQQEEGIGFTAKKPADWLKLINRLRDIEVRTATAEQNRKLAYPRHDISTGILIYDALFGSFHR